MEITNIEDLGKKQKNSIVFADYCRLLYEAATLIYHSEVDRNINIEEINDFKR